MFHHFTGAGFPPGQGAITADQFRSIIEGLGRDTFLSAEVWVEGFLRGDLPPNARCITFDDALRCQKEIAVPVLEEFGLKALFFVYTAHFEGQLPTLEIYRHFRTTHYASPEAFYAAFHEMVERMFGDQPNQRFLVSDRKTWPFFPDFYTQGDIKFQVYRDRILSTPEYAEVMNAMMAEHRVDHHELTRQIMFREEDVKELHRAGHIIGLHSHSHPLVIYQLPKDEQQAEFERCAAWVAKLTGSAPITMSHPAGVYSDTTLAILAELGVRVGFRATTVKLDGGPLEVPRFDHTTCRIALGL
jgi:peptidoglycan/xylan/chitin deacetylase (PgdA/CDA1 family)